MKKSLIISAALVATLLTLAVAGFAYAQTNTPPVPTTPDRDYGYGMHGGMMGAGYPGGMMWSDDSGDADGPLHDEMVDSFADALGLSADELNAQIANGNTMWDIARQQGLSEAEISDLMVTVRAESLKKAVADGDITQEQADWMIARMDDMHATGYGPGSCHGYDNAPTGTAGRRGPGGRWNNQPAN